MITLIDNALLDVVSGEAATSPRGRKNHNFHPRDDYPGHRLLNAIEPGSYIAPHRHLDPNKDETMVVLRGALGLVIFDIAGAVTLVQKVGDAGAQSRGPACGDATAEADAAAATSEPGVAHPARGRFAPTAWGPLDCERSPGDTVVGIDIPHGTWHTVFALEPGTVFLEAKSGPYLPLTDAERAPWAPAENAPEAPAYLAGLRRLFA